LIKFCPKNPYKNAYPLVDDNKIIPSQFDFCNRIEGFFMVYDELFLKAIEPKGQNIDEIIFFIASNRS